MIGPARLRFVRRTYLAFTLTTAFIVMATCAALYVRFSGISWTAPLNQTSLLEQLGFLATVVIPIPFSFSVGGWVWARLAKAYLNLTREEAEALLLGGTFQIAWIDRLNRNAIDKLFER